jgi:putative endonuclease
MKYFFYVIQSEVNGSLYKGITQNIEIRIKQHNEGRNVSTKYNKPYKLIYLEEVNSRQEARCREVYFNSGAGREILKEIINN